MFVCTCACVLMIVYICVHGWLGQRSTLSVISQDTAQLASSHVSVLLGWPSSEPQGSTCLCFSSPMPPVPSFHLVSGD